jgi:hypothetical protein
LNTDVPGTEIALPLGMVKGLTIIADTLACTAMLAESVRGVAITPLTKREVWLTVTTLPKPLMPIVTLPLAVVIATFDVPFTMAWPLPEPPLMPVSKLPLPTKNPA